MLRLPVPALELAALPIDYKPTAMPDELEADTGYCQQVIFEIQMSKVAAILFPQDRHCMFLTYLYFFYIIINYKKIYYIYIYYYI